MKALYDNRFDGYLRPDHGRMIWGETGKPGYGLYDRALGLSLIHICIPINSGSIPWLAMETRCSSMPSLWSLNHQGLSLIHI